jgi:aryl-alcohol dehydrogenase-like predicted oxidoreductase
MSAESNHPPTEASAPSALDSYCLLGRSGLRVSPLALGTMTFGTDWGWGSPKETAFALLDRYIEAGGNFIDTADGYTGGNSERYLGEYFRARKTRDRAVLATKFTFAAAPGDPNSGGNGRKNIYRALEASLHRLLTDYIDVYWLHAWDGMTPLEEVVSTLTDLVREGKIRYFGFSDVPAWYFARAQTLADCRGLERCIALQLEYSLLERNIEREHIPAALELGAGICPWSPLASGMLSGKYSRQSSSNKASGEGRLLAVQDSGNPAFEKLLSDRSWNVVELVTRVARQIGKKPAQVALNWIATRWGVTSTIIGATKLEQLDDNLGALDFEIPAELAAELEAESRPELVHPYMFFQSRMQSMISGGTNVSAEPTWWRP